MPRPFLPPLLIKLNAAAGERELYIYVTQSFREFEQAVFERACEKSATARARSEDAEPREEDNCYPRGGPLSSEVSNAMAAGLRENMIEFERLE